MRVRVRVRLGRTEEEGDEARDHGERRVGELLDVRVGVAQARVQPRLDGVRVRVKSQGQG